MSLGLFLFSFFASLVGVRVVIDFLTRSQIMDRPNDRSSHDVPTPRGAGLALVPVIFVGLLVMLSTQSIAWPTTNAWWAVALGLVLLAVVSWLDDVRPNGLRARYRLLAQGVAVIVPLLFWPTAWGPLFPGIMPVAVERVLIALAWIWFLNLYNFMDGINAITGVQTASVAWGLALLAIILPSDAMTGIGQSAALLLGAALGFLFWNARATARIFLGDIGSIGLGYVVGWLLLVLASTGPVAAAFILPLTYLVDATYTLVRRALNRKKIWEAHREHFYQRATVKGGLSHLRTSMLIAAVNLLLIADAILVAKFGLNGVGGLFVGLILVCGLLAYFKQVGDKATTF